MSLLLQDFESPWLKTKKHWNSFTTSFFLELDDVKREVEQHGKLDIVYLSMSSLLKEDLVCNKCAKALKNMPTLKKHLIEHHPRP